MSFLSFFGLGKRKSSWPEGIPRFYPNIADKDLIPIIPQNVLDERARWPILMILPLASHDSEVDDIALGVGLSRQLVYDLLLIPGLSIRDSSETPQVYLEAAHKQRKDRDPTIYISGTTTAGPGFTRVELSLFFPGRPVAPATVIHETDFPTFYRNLFLAIAQGCGGEVDETFIEKMVRRLPTREGLVELGKLLVREERDFLIPERDKQAISLFHQGVCGTLSLQLLSIPKPDLVRSPDTIILRPELLQGLNKSSEDVQLLAKVADCLRAKSQFDYDLSLFRSRRTSKNLFPIPHSPAIYSVPPEVHQFARRILNLSPGFVGGYAEARNCLGEVSYRCSLSRQIYRLRPGNENDISAWVFDLLNSARDSKTFELASGLIQEGKLLAACQEDLLYQLLGQRYWLVLQAKLLTRYERSASELSELDKEREAIEERIDELDPNQLYEFESAFKKYAN